MVFGILTAVVAAPAIVGTTEAIRYGQNQNRREEHRGRKHNLTVSLARRSFYSSRFDGAFVVLNNHKLWVDTTGTSGLYPVTGYYLPYPGMKEVWQEAGYRQPEGMVTTISDDPPFLNWVYVDSETHEVKYGVRDESEPHLKGPWDVTKVDRRLTFEGWEGFVAVEETEGSNLWALYFDRDDDGLRSGGRIGTQRKRMLPLEVWRRELRRDREAALHERAERLRAREEYTSSESTTVS